MGFEPAQPASHLETVNEFTDRMHSALTEAKAALAKAQEDMTRYYNQRREPAPEYAPGERVGILEWGKTSVYGGVLVRYVGGNLYLDMELATESEVAATTGSTATGAPL